jgi:hypothetical protein
MEALVKMTATSSTSEPSQEELDSTVSRAWCTYMYYNDSETREIKPVLM